MNRAIKQVNFIWDINDVLALCGGVYYVSFACKIKFCTRRNKTIPTFSGKKKTNKITHPKTEI